MKAILLRGPGDARAVQAPEPALRPDGGGVLIKMVSAGICGSDVAAYRGTSPMVTYPRVIGHEGGGVVVEAPAGSGFAAGDRVTVEPYVNCGACYPCSTGRTNCCENMNTLGVHRDGIMCEYFVHPARLLHRVPDALSDTELSLAEPLTISLHALHRLSVLRGEHVLIYGAGPIGNLAAQAALHCGAVPIVADVLEERLELMRSLGVAHVINPGRGEDVVKTVREITNGRLAECVIEATGASALIRQTVDAAAFSGRIAFTGWPKGETQLDTSLFTKKELDLRGSRNSAREFPEAIELISGKKINAASIVSAVVPADELALYLKKQSENPSDYLKVIGVFG